ncbi:MAG TPA: ROK family protein [Candidatus Saccharimonadales bacterium]|nr:ROK family protein [Candidatus Saccharimonadales bacterium]
MFGAVDIGGTKTLLGLFDEKGNLKEEIRFSTPPTYSDFKAQLETHVAKLSTKNYLLVTVAVPGKLDRVKGIGLAFGRLEWKNVPIRDDLEKIFEAPILIENDAKLAGFYEAHQLKDKYSKVLYLTISTGIGGGYIVDGVIDHTLEDAEVGMMLLEHKGKLKHWQDFASGKAILEQFGKKASQISDAATWSEIADNLAIGIIDLIAVLTPDVIIIGGSVGSYFEKYESKLKSILNSYKTDMIKIPDIIMARRPKEAVVYGCFLFGKTKYENSAN